MTHTQARNRRKEIAEYVRSGHSLTEACRHFKVSYGIAYTACQEAGITLKSENYYRIIALLFTSENFSEIARKLRMTRERIRQVYEKAIASGIPVPRR